MRLKILDRDTVIVRAFKARATFQKLTIERTPSPLMRQFFGSPACFFANSAPEPPGARDFPADACSSDRHDFIVSLCGDKISSCRRDVQVENLHPQFKKALARSHLPRPSSSPCGDKIPSCRTQQVENLLPQDSIVSLCGDKIPSCRTQQVENLLPQDSIVADFSFPWRQDFILSLHGHRISSWRIQHVENVLPQEGRPAISAAPESAAWSSRIPSPGAR